jgi:hypothetical protein
MEKKPDVLRRIYTNDKNALINACKYGHVNIVEWILSTTPVSNEEKEQAFLVACNTYNVKLIHLLFNWEPYICIRCFEQAFYTDEDFVNL